MVKTFNSFRYSVNFIPGNSFVGKYSNNLGFKFGNWSVFGTRQKNQKESDYEKSNGELSIGQSIRRHLLDVVDMFPLGLIAIITIKNSDRNQRLGDILAETIVIGNQQK